MERETSIWSPMQMARALFMYVIPYYCPSLQDWRPWTSLAYHTYTSLPPPYIQAKNVVYHEYNPKISLKICAWYRERCRPVNMPKQKFLKTRETSSTILNTLRQPLVKLKFLQFKTKIKGLSLQRRFFLKKKNSHFNS